MYKNTYHSRCNVKRNWTDCRTTYKYVLFYTPRHTSEAGTSGGGHTHVPLCACIVSKRLEPTVREGNAKQGHNSKGYITPSISHPTTHTHFVPSFITRVITYSHRVDFAGEANTCAGVPWQHCQLASTLCTQTHVAADMRLKETGQTVHVHYVLVIKHLPHVSTKLFLY